MSQNAIVRKQKSKPEQQQTQKRYSKWRTYQAGKFPVYDRRLELRMKQSGILNKNAEGLTLQELEDDLEVVENSQTAAQNQVEEIKERKESIQMRYERKEGLPTEAAKERADKDIGEELLLMEAEMDRYTMEVDYLKQLINNLEKEEEHLEKETRLLKFGPVYDINSRAIKDAQDNVLDYEILDVDGQKVTEIQGVRFIDDPDSPYDQMLLKDYYKFCQQWMVKYRNIKGKRAGVSALPRKDLPAFPEWAQKHQKK